MGEELDTTPPTVEGDLSEEETDEIPDSVALDKPVPFDNRRNFLNSFKKTFSTYVCIYVCTYVYYVRTYVYAHMDIQYA